MENSQKTHLLEKLIFLELTSRQFNLSLNEEYWNTYSMLNDCQKDCWGKLLNQICDIYNFINGPLVLNVIDIRVNTIQEFHEKIETVDPIILRVANEFYLALKSEISQETKLALIAIFGKDWFSKNFEE